MSLLTYGVVGLILFFSVIQRPLGACPPRPQAGGARRFGAKVAEGRVFPGRVRLARAFAFSKGPGLGGECRSAARVVGGGEGEQGLFGFGRERKRLDEGMQLLAIDAGAPARQTL